MKIPQDITIVTSEKSLRENPNAPSISSFQQCLIFVWFCCCISFFFLTTELFSMGEKFYHHACSKYSAENICLDAAENISML